MSGANFDMRSGASPSAKPLSFVEFFCGAGMARAGLGSGWRCVFANDSDPLKAASYAANFGSDHLHVCDVAELTTGYIPKRVDLCWASPPCQDLSEAGGRAGLDGARSNAFWPFMRLIEGLRTERRAPRLIVYENVPGLLSSHGGQDFEAVVSAFNNAGYRFGAVIIDAAWFVPQSRERVFIVAVDGALDIPAHLLADKPSLPFQTPPLALLADPLGDPRWDAGRHPLREPIWWRLPVPPLRNTVLADLIEDEPTGVRWDTPTKTAKIMAMMTAANLDKIETAKRAGRRRVGGLYKRMRDEAGGRVQRAEVRFDDIAGCLRVPTGGSSRQTLMIVEGDSVRTRLLSPREAARLMGLPEDYALPSNVNEALGLMGDGVVTHVVRHLAEHLVEPILNSSEDAGECAIKPNLEPIPVADAPERWSKGELAPTPAMDLEPASSELSKDRTSEPANVHDAARKPKEAHEARPPQVIEPAEEPADRKTGGGPIVMDGEPGVRRGRGFYRASVHPRKKHDAYFTPPELAAALIVGLDRLGIQLPGPAFDPCAGDGGLLSTLDDLGVPGFGSDRFPDAYPRRKWIHEEPIDARDHGEVYEALGPCRSLITNPPTEDAKAGGKRLPPPKNALERRFRKNFPRYTKKGLAADIAYACHTLLRVNAIGFVALLLPLPFEAAGGPKRLALMRSPFFRGRIVCGWRPRWIKGTKGGGTMNHCWFIWALSGTGNASITVSYEEACQELGVDVSPPHRPKVSKPKVIKPASGTPSLKPARQRPRKTPPERLSKELKGQLNLFGGDTEAEPVAVDADQGAR
jgi:DNA (cytosine-5)-methyltransferase 1